MKVEKMKESRRWLSWLPKALLATLLAGALAFVGCKSGSDDDDDDGDTTIKVTEVTLKGDSHVLSAAEDADADTKQLTLTATITPDTATNKKLAWKSSDETVATVTPSEDTLSATVSAVAAGKVTITATSADGPKDTYEITVSSEKIVKVDTVTIKAKDDATSVKAGQTLILTAIITPENATDKTVEWESSDKTVATVTPSEDTLSATLTAVAEGKVTITAKAGGKDSNELSIEVTDAWPYTLYSEDFSDMAVVHGWGMYTGNFNANTEGSVTVADGYLQLESKRNNGVFFASAESAALNTVYNVPAGTNYKLTFDLLLGANGNRLQTFAISNANGFAGLLSGENNTSPQGGALIAANVLLSLVQTGVAAETWTLNDDTPVTLPLNKWYSFTVEVADETTYLTITPKDTDTVGGIKRTSFETNGGGLGSFFYAANGTSQIIGFDNIIVKSDTDLPAVIGPKISGTATLAGDGEDTTTLTATTERTSGAVAYEWTSDNDALVKVPEDAAANTVTVTAGKSVKNAEVPVMLKISATANDLTTSRSVRRTLTVQAEESLYTGITLSGAEADVADGKVSGNDGGTLTITATPEVDSDAYGAEDITYEWTSDDDDFVSIEDASKPTATLKLNKATASAVNVTVTVKVGDLEKSETLSVTVEENNIPLTTVTLEPEALTLYAGLGGKTVTANAGGAKVASYEWTSSSGDVVFTDAADKSNSGTTIKTAGNKVIVTATDSAATTSATITVKATPPIGDAVPSEPITVTVKQPTTAWSEDFENATVDDDGNVNYAGTMTVYYTDKTRTYVTLANTKYTDFATAYGKYLNIANKNNERYVTITPTDKTETGTSYKMEFDMSIAAPANGKKMQFVVMADGSSLPSNEGYNFTSDSLLTLDIPENVTWNKDDTNSLNEDWTWNINGTATKTVVLNEAKFYHFTLIVEDDAVTCTIAEKTYNNGTFTLADPLFDEQLTATGKAASGFFASLSGNGGDGRAHICLDNIVVKRAK